jgi:hypothetical protein
MSPLWPHGDPRDVARAVLADPRYRSAAPGPAEQSWWDVLWRPLRALWRAFLDSLNHVFGNDTVTSLIGYAILFAVLVFLVVVLLRFTGRSGWSPWRHAGRGRTPHQADPLHDDADAATLRARALAAAAEGRYRDAAALLWASALRALDERGQVRYDAARTPGEWRRAVRDPAFDALARDAVVALFGGRAVDAALVERMRTAYERVVTPA